MKYTFDNLKDDLLIGREIGFNFRGHRYSIIKNKGKWYLTKFYAEEYEFETVDTLLSSKIQGAKISEIFNNEDFDDLTIF
jgi:hypothetical protein